MSRRRLPWLGLVLALVGCAGAPQAKVDATPSPVRRCKTSPIPVTAVGTTSPAILIDVSAGPGEYLVGVPGSHMVKVFDPSFSPPRLAGDTLYIAQGPPGGQGDSVTAASRSGCRVIGLGVLTALNRVTGDVVISSGSARAVYSADGKVRRQLPLENQYTYTRDGTLVGAGTGGLLRFSIDSGSTNISTQPTQVLGELGPSSLIVEQFGTTRIVDAVTGKTRDLTGHHFFQAAGSPDGKYIAGVDAVSQVPQVLRVSDLKVVPLPQPGPPQSFTWSPDSSEVAVNTPFGASLYRIADTRVTELGLLDLVSW